ncbi:MAG: DNA-directed RNA polymerase subunit alpha [Planctomycetota bacterium]|jgi:DNA-directed RNA polymerase subunit alpha
MLDNTIVLPSKLKIVSEDTTSGVYEIEGLYPGYGHTMGNSLRRIILSSMPGAAITAAKIEGADHEFTTLAGVKEDVMTILLNLRKIRFQMDGEETHTLSLRVTGEKIVTASDIEYAGNVEVLNGDQHIAELTTKTASLNIEITVQHGIGYVSREILYTEKVPVGTMTLDAVFSPIRKVSYDVSNMRVGDRTDYNKLQLSIQTDGSMAPKTVLEQSILIMVAQAQAVLDLKDIAEHIPRVQIRQSVLAEEIEAEVAGTQTGEGDDASAMADVLKTRIDSLELSTRTFNALTDANIRTVGGLAQKAQNDLLELDGLGAKGIDEIKSSLEKLGVDLKD